MTTYNFKLKYFNSVITQHDTNIMKLKNWREAFKDGSKELAKVAHSCFPQVSVAALEECFKYDKKNYKGNAKSFDPWNGKWKGNWTSTWDPKKSTKSKQFHIWDDTVHHNKGKIAQFIQPVTQASPPNSSSKTFIIPDENSAKSTDVDLGINVWSETNGLTGWVSKRQGRKNTLEMPHIAYLLNPNTLLWVAQENFQGPFFIFYETSESNRQAYSIKGFAFNATIVGGKLHNITPGKKIGHASYVKSK